jgi:hypothetical protein
MNLLNSPEVKFAIARAFAIAKRDLERAVHLLRRAGLRFFDACRIANNLAGA